MTKLDIWIANNASKVSALIALLVVIIFALIVYYRGIFSFGPYYHQSGYESYSEENKKLIALINGHT